jgi:hypothetical protein
MPSKKCGERDGLTEVGRCTGPIRDVNGFKWSLVVQVDGRLFAPCGCWHGGTIAARNAITALVIRMSRELPRWSERPFGDENRFGGADY